MRPSQRHPDSPEAAINEHFGALTPPLRLPRTWFEMAFTQAESVAWLYCNGCLRSYEMDAAKVELLRQFIAVPLDYAGPLPPTELPAFDPNTEYFLAEDGCPFCLDQADAAAGVIRIDRPDDSSDIPAPFDYPPTS